MKINRKANVLLLLLMISVLTLLPMSVFAGSMNTQFQTGNLITVDENIDGAAFFTGSNIIINGNVNGALFASGQNVTINGEVNGSVFAAGATVEINGTVQSDAFIAGNTLRVTQNATIQRDLFAAGNTVQIQTPVARDLYVGGYILAFDAPVTRNAYLSFQQVQPGNNASIGGQLNYTTQNKNPQLEEKTAGEVRYATTASMQEEPETRTNPIITKALSILTGLISFLLLGYLLTVLTRERWLTALNPITDKPLPSVGLGVLTLIVTPILVILLLLTRVLIPFALLLALFYFLTIALARFLVAWALAQKFRNRAPILDRWHGILAFAAFYVVLRLLTLLPFVGGLLSFLIVLLALGMVTMQIFRGFRDNMPKQEPSFIAPQQQTALADETPAPPTIEN